MVHLGQRLCEARQLIVQIVTSRQLALVEPNGAGTGEIPDDADAKGPCEWPVTSPWNSGAYGGSVGWRPKSFRRPSPAPACR